MHHSTSPFGLSWAVCVPSTFAIRLQLDRSVVQEDDLSGDVEHRK